MTTYYVETGHGGTDSGTVDNPWLTIDQAMNAVAAGDKVWVKASGTYTETATVDTSGTAESYIVFEGYTTTPGDNGKITWTSSSGDALNDVVINAYYYFKNIIWSACAAHAVDIGMNECVFSNCEFINNSNSAYRNSSGRCTLYKCVFSGNGTAVGLVGTHHCFLGCIFHTTTSGSLTIAGDALVYKCVFYNNDTDGTWINGAADDLCHFIGNTFDGDGTTGTLVVQTTAQLGSCIDNIFYDATTALQITNSEAVSASPVCHNLMNGITNKYYDGTDEFGADFWGTGDVTSAPAFENEAGDDYQPSSSSPAKDAQLIPGGIT